MQKEFIRSNIIKEKIILERLKVSGRIGIT